MGGTRVKQSHLATVSRDGVTIITVRDGLFDALPESDDSVPLAAEVAAEFRSAVGRGVGGRRRPPGRRGDQQAHAQRGVPDGP